MPAFTTFTMIMMKKGDRVSPEARSAAALTKSTALNGAASAITRR